MEALFGASSPAFSQEESTEDSYFKGFYQGVNVFIRNPFKAENQEFCIQKIYVNGKTVSGDLQVSAYEIDLSSLAPESRVVIRVVHELDCKPELINPEVIQNDLKFRFLRIYVNESSVIWVSSKEDRDGYYAIERLENGEWNLIDTVHTKGGIFLNQHTHQVQHAPGDNTYRVAYHFPNDEVELSEAFLFHSDKREISYAIDMERRTIEFSESTKYQLLSTNYRLLKRGQDLSVDISKIPRGKYILKYDGKEYKVQW